MLYVLTENLSVLVNTNDLFSVSGLVSLKPGNRFIGDRPLMLRRLACDVQGRLARFSQMKFTPNDIYLYTLLDFMELLRGGFPQQLIKLVEAGLVGPYNKNNWALYVEHSPDTRSQHDGAWRQWPQLWW